VPVGDQKSIRGGTGTTGKVLKAMFWLDESFPEDVMKPAELDASYNHANNTAAQPIHDLSPAG